MIPSLPYTNMTTVGKRISRFRDINLREPYLTLPYISLIWQRGMAPKTPTRKSKTIRPVRLKKDPAPPKSNPYGTRIPLSRISRAYLALSLIEILEKI